MGESVEDDFQPLSQQTGARGYIFSCKIKKTSHPSLNFNNNSVKQVQFQKHLGFYLDGKLNLREHFQKGRHNNRLIK